MATVYFNSPQLACLFFGADGNGCTHQAGDMTFCTCGKRSAMDALEVDFKSPAADDLWLKTACCCYHCGFNFGEGLCDPARLELLLGLLPGRGNLFVLRQEHEPGRLPQERRQHEVLPVRVRRDVPLHPGPHAAEPLLVPRARVEVGHARPRLLGVLHVRQGPGLLHVQQVRVSLQRRSAL